MKFFYFGTDGGENSGVTGFWLCEIKWLFSVVLLHFKKGSREKYHSHAFNAYSFYIKGEVKEYHLHDKSIMWKPSIYPKYTSRTTFHKIYALKDTWCLSFRGPWVDYWCEYSPKYKEYSLLTKNRRILNKWK